jgi:acetyl esterase/lipase
MVLDAIDSRFPPAHITTACHDFLRQNAQPMFEFLTAKSIEAEVKCYGTEDDETIGHVFHVNISLPEATACNDDQTAFFKRYL